MAGCLASACIIPEYKIDGDGSGGAVGNGGSDTGGGTSGDGTSLPSGGGGAGTGGSGDGGESSGSGSASGDGGGSAGGQDGAGGNPGPWSCADEEPELPVYFSNGTLCGYRYAFEAPEDSTTYAPPCTTSDGSDCFDDAQPYVTGTVPASSPPVYPALGIGVRLAQRFDGTIEDDWELSGYGLAVDYVAEGAAQPGRVQLLSNGHIYCAQATRNTALAWADFRFECWDSTSTQTLDEGDPVEELQVTIASGDSAQTIAELDIRDITLHGAEPPFVCDGCAQLFVPLAGAAVDAATVYSIELSDTDMGEDDLRLVARVYVETVGTTGGLQVVLWSNGPGPPAAHFWSELTAIKGWHDIVVAPADAAGAAGFDPNEVEAIGIQITAGAPPADTVLADATVYVDSITFTGSTSHLMPVITFDSSVQGMVMGDNIPGSTIEWMRSD